MDIVIRPIEKRDLPYVQELWADGEVMKFVGFPDGLHVTDDQLLRWYEWGVQQRPDSINYSIFVGDEYCGETFYSIDFEHDCLTSLDIKLFERFRGKGIASKALRFTIEQARLQGAKKVWVNPNEKNAKAIELYKRLGFEKAEIPEVIIEQEGVGDYLYMEKQLPDKGENTG